MIEIFNKKKKRIGYIKEKKYFDKKNRLIGYLEGNAVKNKSGGILLKYNKHDDIIVGNEKVGFILNSQVCFREKPIFEFSEEKREIHTLDGKESLILIGNHEKINDLDLLAVATVFLKSKWWDIIYGYW